MSRITRALPAASVDVLAVLVFAFVGRRNHEEAAGLGDVVTTSVPFLGGLAVGWLVTRAWREPTRLAVGVGVWVAAVLGGLAVRAVTVNVPPVSFALVTATVLGLFMLGWRAAAVMFDRGCD
ncbi:MULTISPECIES: DUF3054 domain-containing protein [Actinoalloteichus]|uniref:DUF3054 family protein n=1 Tax=Actinoalloteichus fjordicus TaxID=1612552 RepID=A0AAC9LCG6_9PSEU|nr:MULTISPECIES: DUF3054 domain-containing protein [Actinoalloteichus]APU13870.1 putative DUF3054 family protein [Actinoalloteichus fjordicus]APU19816.1 putative DUF3054 family protein [Actinoalloteichus sp. GBA129-24]